MIVRDGRFPKLRKVLAVLADTKIDVVAGNGGPQYVMFRRTYPGVPKHKFVDEERVLRVGLRWLEQHYPDAFAEFVSARLRGEL